MCVCLSVLLPQMKWFTRSPSASVSPGSPASFTTHTRCAGTHEHSRRCMCTNINATRVCHFASAWRERAQHMRVCMYKYFIQANIPTQTHRSGSPSDAHSAQHKTGSRRRAVADIDPTERLRRSTSVGTLHTRRSTL